MVEIENQGYFSAVLMRAMRMQADTCCSGSLMCHSGNVIAVKETSYYLRPVQRGAKSGDACPDLLHSLPRRHHLDVQGAANVRR